MKELPWAVTALPMMMAAIANLTLGVGGSPLTSGLPRPWLTLSRTAKVLHLKCSPPPEASRWTAVHDLRLSAFLHHYSVSSNVSLVNMTSNMEQPKVNNMFDIFRVSFQWKRQSRSPSLDFRFPVEGNKLGRYFCLVVYSDPDDKPRELTTEITVGEDFVYSHKKTLLVNKNNFEVSVFEAHKVKLTWMEIEGMKFEEATVSRIPVDEEGNGIAPSRSLFTTNGVSDFVYDSDLVLLDKLYEQNNNLSIDLYVEKDQHIFSYRYSCSVPYPACTGHKDVFCTCCQPGSDPDRQTCPPVSEPCNNTPFVVGLSLLIVFALIIILALIVYCLYKKNDRCSKSSCLNKIFAQKRESSPEKKDPETEPLKKPENPTGDSARPRGNGQKEEKRVGGSPTMDNDNERDPQSQSNQPRRAGNNEAPQVSPRTGVHSPVTLEPQPGNNANVSCLVYNRPNDSRTQGTRQDKDTETSEVDDKQLNDQPKQVQMPRENQSTGADGYQGQRENSHGAAFGGQSAMDDTDSTNKEDHDLRLKNDTRAVGEPARSRSTPTKSPIDTVANIFKELHTSDSVISGQRSYSSPARLPLPQQKY